MQLIPFKIKFWKGQQLLLLAFLLLHTIASFYYISKQNITYDEPDYIEYAKRWLHGKPERIQPLDDSKSPVIAICWLPRIIRQLVNPNYQLNDYGKQDQEEGRYMMILFSFLAALYMYKWCNQLYGAKGWQLPLLMLLFDPLYLSYSTIITTDLACGSFLVALLYHYKNYITTNNRRDFYLAAVFTGLAIVTKQSMLFVLLLLPTLSTFYYVFSTDTKPPIQRIVGKGLLFLLVIVASINIAYYFKGSFMPLGNYSFESNTLSRLQHSLSFLSWLPVPLPFAYVQSVDMLKAHADIGAGTPFSTFNGVYLFGDLKLSGGYWYYYLVVLFYKMPIGTMLLLAASVVLFIKKFIRKSFLQQYIFLVVPIIFYWVVLSFFNQFQSGVRHLLLVFPLIYIGLGYLFKQVSFAALQWKITTGVAVLYTFATVAIYYPHLIPYTNEFITDKKTVYRKIYDSSVDYGQSDSSVKYFLSTHKEFQAATISPAVGKFAVVTGDMLNTYLKNNSRYKWYLAMEPKGHYRYTILLFDVTQDDVDRIDTSKMNFNIIKK